ncbi:NAD(P)H-dependent oxidoreductase [Paraburkholderia piptadeniae]|nr:NAD(P)H-dependent oxidoreductase [Paraburkholderia piptadeniae]
MQSIGRRKTGERQSEGGVIATPEYNGGYTAQMKSAIDWISRPRGDG